MHRENIVRSAIALLSALCVLGCGGGGSGNPQPAPATPPPQSPSPPPPPPAGAVTPVLDRTVVMSGLQSPWDLAFAPDGVMLFTEKCRGLSIRDANGATRRLFGSSGAAVVASDFFCEGQTGMHGVAVDPEFAANRFVYVYMPSNLSSPASNRVVRLTLDAGYTTVSNRTDIVTNIAFKSASNAWGGVGAHSGGRIRFHPTEGLLYVTTGDNHNGPLPQDVARLGGKVLRITRDGVAAPGNGTPAGGIASVFTFGHRNVQGIAFRPSTGQPFSCEHGPGHTDEVTPLVAGGNGGWDPQPAQGVSCTDNYCGYTSNKPDGSPTPMTDLGKFPNAMRPSWTNSGNSQGMGPCTFLSGAQWSAWDGHLAVGIMAAQRLDLLQLDSGGTTSTPHTVTGLPTARVRSLVQGPDGSLYVATDGGEIWRLTPRTSP
jgi:aldose sugar dehydrogenase